MLQAGQQAPEFELENQQGDRVALAGFTGRTVVLYFYPKADTPGCTRQACGVRDRRGEYESAGAVVLGVSPDPVAKLARFADKHGLDHALLSDLDHAVAEAYGVWVQKSMYGRSYWGVARATFIIGPSGEIVHVLAKVNPKSHDEEVLGLLAS
ncbi:MAG: thioredoxin-dependent thiol peroxidase [Solirubrobacteraceae bacterium]